MGLLKSRAGVREEADVIAGGSGVPGDARSSRHYGITNGGHARPILEGIGFFFPIADVWGVIGRHAAVEVAIQLILGGQLRGGHAEGGGYYGGGFVAVRAVILACNGIANTEAGSVFKRKPGLQKTAEFDDAKHEEEQDG